MREREMSEEKSFLTNEKKNLILISFYSFLFSILKYISLFSLFIYFYGSINLLILLIIK